MAEGLIKHLALVSESNRVDMSELTKVSAALQKQVTRDFAPVWGVQATIDAFARLEDVPTGYWPMIVMDDIGFDAAGIHLDRDGQPYALITSSNDNDVWSLTASHETLEMLADPFGDRTVPGDSPKPDQGRVLFLVEVCDPSEAAEFGYTVNGVLVSDFYTPRYFDPVRSNGVQYSFTGDITEPRDVLRGGYLSWLEPISDHWWQEIWFSGNQSKFRDLGPLNASKGSIRNQIDQMTGAETHKAMQGGRKRAAAALLEAAAGQEPSAAKAERLRQEIDEILTGRPERDMGEEGVEAPRRRGAATTKPEERTPHRRRPKGARRGD